MLVGVAVIFLSMAIGSDRFCLGRRIRDVKVNKITQNHTHKKEEAQKSVMVTSLYVGIV